MQALQACSERCAPRWQAVDWGSEYEDSDEFFLEEYDEEGDVVDFD